METDCLPRWWWMVVSVGLLDVKCFGWDGVDRVVVDGVTVHGVVVDGMV